MHNYDSIKIINVVCEILNFTCLNGGNCDDSTGFPICNCPSTKYGDHCEKTVGKGNLYISFNFLGKSFRYEHQF